MVRFAELETVYGLNIVKSQIIPRKEDAVKIAASIGYPVALKIESPDILHKSDIGAVKLDIQNKEQLLIAYDEIMNAVKKNFSEAKIDGIAVQEMLPEGFEFIIGYINDRVFGPCLMAGMGGIFTEAVKDIVFRTLPVTKEDAYSMIRELKFSKTLLKGFRHIKKISIEIVAEVLMKVSRLAQDNLKKMESFDINPAIFYDDDYKIVDFKYIQRKSGTINTGNPDIQNIERFFNASSIAVVGASPVITKLGYNIVNNLKTNGYKGKVYPINPKYKEILGLKSYPDVVSIKEEVELVIVLVSLNFVVGILEQCCQKNIRNVIIISAGGKESGNAQLEEDIKNTAKKYGIRIIGCNCIGVFDANTRVDSMFFSYNNMRRSKPGGICMMSQSGTVGLCAIDILPYISKFVSYGNRIDVDEADLLKYFSSDKNTKVIAIYIEGLLKGRKFYDALKSVTSDIPVIVYKAGRSESASKAAVSHTGFLAGTHNMIYGILRQAGAYQADSFEAFLAASRTLDKYKRVKSNKTLMITNGAGITIQAIDRIDSKGILELTTLSDNTINDLRKVFGTHISLANPVDLTGTATEEDYEAAISAAVSDKNIDIIMIYIVFHVSTMTEKMLDIVAKYADKKPIIFCSIGADHTISMKNLLEKKNIPTFSSVEEWVSAAESLIYVK
jgi:3-hydroxypropionyl-CoA synthetase (ADP-forming)